MKGKTMTVDELRAALAKCDGNAEVVGYAANCCINCEYGNEKHGELITVVGGDEEDKRFRIYFFDARIRDRDKYPNFQDGNTPVVFKEAGKKDKILYFY